MFRSYLYFLVHACCVIDKALRMCHEVNIYFVTFYHLTASTRQELHRRVKVKGSSFFSN